MIKRTTLIILGIIHDILLIPFFIIFQPVSILFKAGNDYRKTRSRIFPLLKAFKESDKKRIVFYCSSVGEFEQALPLINKYSKSEYHCIIFFHSPKGLDYAQTISDFDVYATPYDFFCFWGLILCKIKAEKFIINRNEFWPGAVMASSAFSVLIIINYIVKEKTNFFQSIVHRLAQITFTVNETPSPTGFIKSGDTRIDRLQEKFRTSENSIKSLRPIFHKYLSDNSRLIVVGNAYDEDISFICSLDSEYFRTSKFLFIPSRKGISKHLSLHDIPSENQEYIDWNLTPLVAWHSIGRLFEAYSLADIAWIGGGFGKGVHNCLEPDFFGLPMISGPNLHNQVEAIDLLKRNRLVILKDQNQLQNYLLSYRHNPEKTNLQTEKKSPTNLIFHYLNENNNTR